MGPGSRIKLNSVLVGDELGQLKLVQLDSNYDIILDDHNDGGDISLDVEKSHTCDRSGSICTEKAWSTMDKKRRPSSESSQISSLESNRSPSVPTETFSNNKRLKTHRIIRILDECLQREPSLSRAITNIRPIETCHENHIDSTDRPNNLFVVSNRVGQLFVCDTDSIRQRLRVCQITEFLESLQNEDTHEEDETSLNLENNLETFLETEKTHKTSNNPMISPIYYNMNSRAPVIGVQPVNQTNLLVLYRNGDIQHVNIGQDVLQSTLKIKRKAIRMLGMGYNSDARAVHWRIDGGSGLCYFNTDGASSAHMDENDPLTDIVLSSPTHKLTKEMKDKSRQNLLYQEPPSIHSRKYNELERLVPTQVINMITSRTHNFGNSSRLCKWSSITSLNLIYRKLALYDLVGSNTTTNGYNHSTTNYRLNTYKLNGDRLAVGGYGYAARVYDVQTQKPIYNLITGAKKNPITCPPRGESAMVADLDWLGGNKTTMRLPNMLATCSGCDSLVDVFDLRCVKPVYHIDLTYETENKWQSYDNQSKGAIFTNLCVSGAPYSTAVPSQQIVLGSTNGQLHLVDLRFLAKSQRHLGRMSGFSGGPIKELRFVSESSEISKLISCSDDRFMRVHRIRTAYTSFLSQKLAAKIFLSTKPTCIQPICDRLSSDYADNISPIRYKSVSHLSTYTSGSWSLF